MTEEIPGSYRAKTLLNNTASLQNKTNPHSGLKGLHSLKQPSKSHDNDMNLSRTQASCGIFSFTMGKGNETLRCLSHKFLEP